MVKPPRAVPAIFWHRAMTVSTRDTASMMTPRKVTICMGAVEKDVMLVRAYLVRARRDHFDLPAARSCTSNSTVAVL